MRTAPERMLPLCVHYDSSQESLSLLSIPRDTRVDVCPDARTQLLKAKIRVS